MKQHRSWHLIGALAVVGLAFALPNPVRSAEYSVHVVEPAITNHVILAGEPLPPVCQPAASIRLSACRGEYEPASFVVTASQPLEAVRVEVGQLRGPGGEWPQSAVDVRLVKEVSRGIISGGARIPTLLVHDDNFLLLEPAPTETDPAAVRLATRGPVMCDAAELQAVDIAQRRQFWITVRVPDHAEAGTYTTVLRLAPANAEAMELTLDVEVYTFDLLDPMLEYSIYYPAYLSDQWTSFGRITEAQYEAELRNMLAHGLDNPDIYDDAKRERVVELRRRAGMQPRVLYHTGHRALYTDRPLTEEEKRANQQYVRDINAWAAARGFDEVYLAGPDEWWGELLRRAHDSYLSVHEAGGKSYVACRPDFWELVGDVLHRPVVHIGTPQGRMEQYVRETQGYTPLEQMRNADEIAAVGAAALERLTHDTEVQQVISGVHRLGRKIYCYTTYQHPLPDFQRLSHGLGLWRLGFDGNKDWAYTHIGGDKLNQSLGFAMVFRTENGVLDTLHWEGFREGVDDVRYLTTLLDVLGRAAGRYPEDPLVAETAAWIQSIDVFQGDLEVIRREMAQRIVALLDLGPRKLSPEEALAGVAVESIQVMPLSEPWRWKMDPQNRGIDEAWFARDFDDSDWQPMRTDTKDKGWGSAVGYGWYRNELPLTAEQDASAQYAYLHFGACDEDAWVYVNGQEVLEHSCQTMGLLNSQIWLRRFVVPLTGVELSGDDLLAVRVYNREAMGGIWKPVHLVLSPEELTDQQVQAMVDSRSAEP